VLGGRGQVDPAGEIDPYYSDAESDLLVAEAGSDVDAPWVTGEGPGMQDFAYFNDFIAHYNRIYSPSEAMFHAWAQAV
jgi:hypothetical protein